MRHVQVTVNEEKRDQVLEVLDEEGIDYVLTETTDDPDYAVTVFFPLPTEAVEPVLQSFEELGVGDAGHSVTVPAESVVSSDFEELQRQFEAAEDTDDQMAFEELRTQARELLPTARTYALLSVVSAVVATAGLLLDSPAIVVGSMVIAPLVGPAMATGVGSVLYEERLFREGVKYQIAGFALAVASSIAFAVLAREVFLVPPTLEVTDIGQVAGRLTPDLLSLAVAFGSGIAGARSLSSDISTALVGVMIAAALVPPAAAVGIGVAWWDPGVVFNAGLLVLVNALSINLAALATLWATGYRPIDRAFEDRARVATYKRLLALAVVVLALSAVLIAFTATAYRTAVTTRDVRADVDAVVGGDAYADLSALDTEVVYTGGVVGMNRRPARVVVTVSRPTDAAYPDLAARLRDRIERDLEEDVAVQVRYVDVDSARALAREGSAVPSRTGRASAPNDRTGRASGASRPGERGPRRLDLA
ncbi:MAG: TIGR00341 family protein [Halosimplex sp.]